MIAADRPFRREQPIARRVDVARTARRGRPDPDDCGRCRLLLCDRFPDCPPDAPHRTETARDETPEDPR